jgi:DNA segregation ATPase FtsK/SpoIIIE-like protein
MQSAGTEFESAMQTLQTQFVADGASLERTLQQTLETVGARFEKERNAIQKEYLDTGNSIRAHYKDERATARTILEEARWTASAVHEGRKARADSKLRKQTGKVATRQERLGEIRREACERLREWGQPLFDLERDPTAPPVKLTARKLSQCLANAEDHLDQLRALIAPRWLVGGRLIGLFFLMWLAWIYPAGWLVVHLTSMPGTLIGILGSGLAVGGVAALALGAIVHALLSARARSQIEAQVQPLAQALDEAEARCQGLNENYRKECDRRLREAKKRYKQDVRAAKSKYEGQRSANKLRRERSRQESKILFKTRRKEALSRRANDLQQADQTHVQDRDALQQRFSGDQQKLQGRHLARLDEIQTRHDQGWLDLAKSWHDGLTALERGVAEVHAEDQRYFPPWKDPSWKDRPLVTDLPPVLRFGTLEVKRQAIPHGLPADTRLQDAWLDDFLMPAFCSFPERYSILFETPGEGRAAAVTALQALLFRLLTGVPPGKVRFTIIDPVGLGQNFAALMHLADHDPLLVSSRIWTEPAHIEQRLSDLTAHMENVIQKYLRNRYQTILEYNAEAGEVAEPFRVLVVADFPVNFSEAAARRLVSICQSGPRCGVTTLITVDMRQPLPRGFDLADLEQAGAVLIWHDGRFVWKDEDFGPYPLTLDRPPEDAEANRLLERVGKAAQNARRVEVPFEFIVPPSEAWWTSDSRHGLSVPLGRSGATRRQYLQLGQGTAQHVLVAGKTGSGKSTLLHALILNLALHYSPREVELYLIDFKKGVEFKTYAVHELPHARVVAIESEREFGLSVLQRLDAELKLRGERFREVGAQDLNAYRQARPDARAPRILMIVDEFQEFFTEDDRIAQDAAQLLDRLVRQGRAFGLHVLLGSQTLGGAYSLARSTIDQMAVRIALQCSEADAQLILSADNSAARLLTRPGEAIYNDANGLIEGNSPFQVVWLPEHRREDYLQQVQERARKIHWSEGTAIFEGNAPADVSRNLMLRQVLSAPTWPAVEPRVSRQTCVAWVGEAMSITGQTGVTFRRQNGSNLLLVGQQPEAAQGMLATAVISLAAQMPPVESSTDPARFYVIDGSQADAPDSGPLARLAGSLRHSVRLSGWRQLPALLAEVASEVDRRQKTADTEAPSIYFVLYALQRCRDLRRQEDDFGFGRKEEAPSPPQQLATVLREGAALGVHTLIWCDTLTNLQRALDRQSTRELALRVVFQMSVADSSNLIDNPLAAKLGLHRALFASEEDGRLEKFRPYGLPPDSWLDWVKQQFEGKAAR